MIVLGSAHQDLSQFRAICWPITSHLAPADTPKSAPSLLYLQGCTDIDIWDISRRVDGVITGGRRTFDHPKLAVIV